MNLLQEVSRSFYLSLRVLPPGLREPVGIAYLLARAADTLADTRVLPPEVRLKQLLAFRSMVEGTLPLSHLQEIGPVLEERDAVSPEGWLLASLPEIFSVLDTLPPYDRTEIRSVVSMLTRGMEWDLTRFPPEESGKVGSLRDDGELDRYTYLVAGCVGEFWTRLASAHLPALRNRMSRKELEKRGAGSAGPSAGTGGTGGRPEGESFEPTDPMEALSRAGIQFGKALQMTNILRDFARDLRIGRSYLPEDVLLDTGFTPEGLRHPGFPVSPGLLRVLRLYLERTLALYQSAEEYLRVVPRRCVRLRLAVLWPAVIGLETLARIRPETWLDPASPAKVPRSRVYRILALSLPLVFSNRLLALWLERLMRRVRAHDKFLR